MKNHWLKRRDVKDTLNLAELAQGCTLDLCYEWQFVQDEKPQKWERVAQLMSVTANLKFHSLLNNSIFGICNNKLFTDDGDGRLQWKETDERFGFICYEMGTIAIPEELQDGFVISYEYNYAENN